MTGGPSIMRRMREPLIAMAFGFALPLLTSVSAAAQDTPPDRIDALSAALAAEQRRVAALEQDVARLTAAIAELSARVTAPAGVSAEQRTAPPTPIGVTSASPQIAG